MNYIERLKKREKEVSRLIGNTKDSMTKEELIKLAFSAGENFERLYPSGKEGGLI